MEKMPDNPNLDPVQLVLQMYDALNRGSVADILDLLAEDVFWEVPGPQDILPWAGGRHGRSGVAEFFELFGKTVKTTKFTLQRLITQGNTVVAVIDYSCIARATNLAYVGSMVQLVTVEGGKIKALQYYMDTFPIVEAFLGGRPFTVKFAEDTPYYVVVPLASKMKTDSFVLDPVELEDTPAAFNIVRQMYAALQASDMAGLHRVLADDVLWHMFGPSDLLSWAGQRFGSESAIESAGQILETLKIEYSRPVRFISQGNTVVVVIDEGGTSRATGLPFKTSVVHLITVSDVGTIKQVLNYINTTWIVEAFLGGRPFTIT